MPEINIKIACSNCGNILIKRNWAQVRCKECQSDRVKENYAIRSRFRYKIRCDRDRNNINKITTQHDIIKIPFVTPGNRIFPPAPVHKYIPELDFDGVLHLAQFNEPCNNEHTHSIIV